MGSRAESVRGTCEDRDRVISRAWPEGGGGGQEPDGEVTASTVGTSVLGTIPIGSKSRNDREPTTVSDSRGLPWRRTIKASVRLFDQPFVDRERRRSPAFGEKTIVDR